MSALFAQLRDLTHPTRTRLPHIFSHLPPLISFPFLSGDLFKASAPYLFSSSSPHLHRRYTSWQSPPIIFSEPDNLDSGAKVEQFLSAAGKLSPLKSVSLIIHNGDKSVPEHSLRALSRELQSVFAVNVHSTMYQDVNIFALPIGLENFPWRGETYFKFFHHLNGEQATLFHWNQRPTRFHSSFSVRTNPVERAPLERTLAEYGLSNTRLPWRRFSSALLTSKFIFSPPGNGFDCHRTWEAIYAGSIPIVKRGTLDDGLVKLFPIWEVDEWEKPFTLDDDELTEVAKALFERTGEQLFAPYWLRKLGS